MYKTNFPKFSIKKLGQTALICTSLFSILNIEAGEIEVTTPASPSVAPASSGVTNANSASNQTKQDSKSDIKLAASAVNTNSHNAIDYGAYTKDEFIAQAKLCEELFTQKDKNAYTTCKPISESKAAGPKLQYIMANIFFEGIGVARNNEMGLNWLYRAYNSGNIDAKKDLGIFSLNIYLSNHNIGTGNTGLNLLKDAAKAGNAEAEYFLADLQNRQEFSELGTYNPAQAFTAMKKLADKGTYLPAQTALAEMYILGTGTQANAKTGYAILLKAAKLGSADALHQLSLLEEGNNELENHYLAYVHQYQYTSCKNSSGNMIRLDKLASKLKPEELERARQEAKAQDPKKCL